MVSHYERLKALCSENGHSEALILIDELEAAGCETSQLLVTKAMCLQLVEDGGSLTDVEAAFERALDLDSRNVQALVEFAWFKFNVRDDAGAAECLFQRALSVQASVSGEIVSGLVRCRQELFPGVDVAALRKSLIAKLTERFQI